MATYYVANAGSDSANGLSASAAFKTIAHAVGALQASDTLLLNRGDRWYESLTIPANSITVDAYGAAPVYDSMGYCTNAPILDQGTAVTTWTAYAGGTVEKTVVDTFTGSAGVLLSAHTPDTGTSWVRHGSYASDTMVLAGDGTIRQGAGAHTEVYMCTPTNAIDCFVQVDSVWDTVEPTETCRVVSRGNTSGSQTFYTGKLVSDGTIAISRFLAGTGVDLATGSVAAPQVGETHTIRLEAKGPTLSLYIDSVLKLTASDINIAGWNTYAGIYLATNAGVSNSTHVHAGNFSCGPLDAMTGPVNTYKATVATARPYIVSHNQTYCFEGTAINSLKDQEYHWFNNTLYFRNDAGALNDTEIVRDARNNGVAATSLTGVTVQNVAVEHSRQPAFQFVSCTGPTVNACYAQITSAQQGGGYAGAIDFENCTNVLAQNSFIRNTGACGIYANGGSLVSYLYNTVYGIYEPFTDAVYINSGVANGNSSSYCIIRGNVLFYPNWADGLSGARSSSSKGAIISFSDYTLIERNFVAYAPGFGITMPANNLTVRDNVIYKSGSGPYYTVYLGIHGGGGGLRFATNGGVTMSGNKVYRNLCLECPTGIWGYIDVGHTWTNVTVANNTCINFTVPPATSTWGGASVNTLSTGRLMFFSGGFGGSFENNIIYNFQGSQGLVEFDTISGSWTSDYNVLGPDITGGIVFTGTTYDTLAAYVAGKGKDAHSTAASPAFYNAGYTPSGSPTSTIVADTMLPFRNEWRSAARQIGTVIAGVTQLGQPDAGLEATYGYWGSTS